MAAALVMLVLGAGLAAWNTWQRLGRSPAARRWARGPQPEAVRRKVLVVWPLAAVALLLGAAVVATEDAGAASVATVLPFLVVLALLLAYLVLPVPVPGFVEPRWYRAETAGERGGRRG